MTAPRLLVCIISGGRPRPEQRPTDGYLRELQQLGPVEYVVREDQAGDYTIPSDTTLNTYPVPWADEYAESHWRHPRAVFTPGGFHGAFTGREWAMRTAEERGFDAVLQLDDNINALGPINANANNRAASTSPQRMFRAASELLLSSNVMMLGLQLASVAPAKAPLLRTGFPYSAFWEQAGAGRMPYFGPFEDDIMHAMEYGLNGGPGRTVGIIPHLTYAKESKSKTGMRAHYNTERGLELPRRYPRNARIVEARRTSAVNDTRRGVRHVLRTAGFTPIRATDQERFDAALRDVAEQIRAGRDEMRARSRAKIRARAAR